MRTIVLTGVIMPAYVLAYSVEHITTMPPVPRQLPAGLSSAEAFLTSCGDSCTDVIQSKYQSARLRINPDDQYCNNYANTPGEGACYCGNYLNDAHAVSLLSSCIVNTCTIKAPQEVLDYIDVTGEFIPQMTGQLSLLCPNSIKAFAFTGDVQPPSSTGTTITSSSTSKSTSSSSSATPSPSHSSTASSTSISTSTSTSSTSTGSPTSSPDSVPKKLVLMDSVYLATTLCGVIMAVTAYML
ncbi:hypothetical protein EV421DRAFT_486636 [Armillaria borealis]|uniref:Extracellular membrane protein CFEM domain-containing protein n=1 Tax=Armillaria borealis TaxID=47425 RepID=A0AA39JK02_9AGAR|nr:hypothetical protein EV421DRAFT_486636 [Armillaria borealis]